MGSKREVCQRVSECDVTPSLPNPTRKGAPATLPLVGPETTVTREKCRWRGGRGPLLALTWVMGHTGPLDGAR
jgi:hypothetical protein